MSQRVVVAAAVLLLSVISWEVSFSVIKLLGYELPAGYTIFNLDIDPEPVLGWVFWGSLLFSIIGKKIDYLIIFFILLLSFYLYSHTQNVTIPMYFGLIGAALLGTTIGSTNRFVFKKIRGRLSKKQGLSKTVDKKRSSWHQLVTRLAVLIVVIILGSFTSYPFHEFNSSVFSYQKPAGFFGFTLADWELAWTLASLFWGGVLFGALGKKIDYIFIFVLGLLTLLDYFYTENVTPAMYLGLIAVAGLGNVLGYMLKVGRQNWLGK